ncbi:hypothetical protein [uncultured Pontibacter sp.]|uniref:hypothetical protein n=1 Tax=uncultured Pontibacter sp. TaxID=453356 RepID=UPI002622F75D|nr:hypothetical protein [uncultured Pontibacter sp.]
MKNAFIYFFILAFGLSCSPKNDEVKDEHVEVGEPADALDSVANTRLDAVNTDENEITPTLPLPPAVLRLLSQKYPGNKQPTLTGDVSSRAEGNEQGPLLVRGNFTDDNRQDYALQLQHDKNLLIVAVTDTGDGNWALHELKRDILFNDRGTLKSTYHLYLAEPGHTMLDPASGEKTELEREAVSVALSGDVTTYVYAKNGFRAYNSLKD